MDEVLKERLRQVQNAAGLMEVLRSVGDTDDDLDGEAEELVLAKALQLEKDLTSNDWYEIWTYSEDDSELERTAGERGREHMLDEREEP